MEVIGFIGALIMGITLGLMGGGGSILTVPILVYFFDKDPVTATGLSLFVVGITSSAGLYAHYKNGAINWRVSLVFGIASLICVFATRFWLLPLLPDPLLQLGTTTISKGTAILVLFAALMLAASISMIRKQKPSEEKHESENTYALLIIGLIVGLVTGILGAGGGFLIVPGLVLLAGVDIKKAVGTSLFLITMNTFVGFFSDRDLLLSDHWSVLMPIMALAVIGSSIGSRLTTKVDGKQLRPIFGWFVLTMGTFIIIKELLNLS